MKEISMRAVCPLLALLCLGNNVFADTTTVPNAPTLGENSGYTYVDTAAESNTGLSFIQTVIDSQTKDFVSQTTKYIDIKKTTYNNGADTITYYWNEETHKLEVTLSGSSVSTAGVEYIGKTTRSVSNSGTLDSVTGEFIGNSSTYYGSVIGNSGTIGTITGNFIGNFSASTYYTYIIYNTGTIGTITGDFIGNVSGAISQDGYGSGGTKGNITTINGDFIGNTTTKAAGAINNYCGTIGTINGNFIGNRANGHGGAIYNNGGTIGTINGNFIGNYSGSQGGAINDYQNNSSYTVNGNFIGNSSVQSGGAINVDTGTVTISGDFIGNSTGSLGGGAIKNVSGTVNLKGNTFKDNKQSGWDNDISNDAGTLNILENATVNIYSGISSGNYSKLNLAPGSTMNLNIANGKINSYSLGKVANQGTINANIDIDIDNQTSDVIYANTAYPLPEYELTNEINITELNFMNGSIEDILDQLLVFQILHKVYGTQEADIELKLAEGLIPESLEEEVILQHGEKVAKSNDFDGTANWSSTYNSWKEAENIVGHVGLTDTETYHDSLGITVTGTDIEITDITSQGDTLKIVNQSDISTRTFNATTEGETYTAVDDLGTTAAGTMTINGNPLTDPEGERTKGVIDLDGHTGFELGNATTLNIKDTKIINASGDVISSTNADAEINLENTEISGSLKNNAGTLNVGENVKLGLVYGAGTTNINSDFTLDNVITGNTLTLNNGAELKIEPTGSLSGTSQFIVNSGSLNLQNGVASDTNLGNLVLNSDMDLKIDGNFSALQLDTITVESITPNDHYINISDINILTPTTQKSFLIPAIGAMTDDTVKDQLASAIQYTGGDIAMTPIYTYNVAYNPATGNLGFTRTGGNDEFNPAVIASPVAAETAAAQGAISNTFGNAFQHADVFMSHNFSERITMLNANKYAISDENPKRNGGISTDFNGNLGHIDYDHINKGIWVQPYTTFEKINLHNGPKVHTINYGTLIGADTDFRKLKNGWYNVGTAYIGYNGSQLNYKGVDTTVNGGIIGLTETFYKGNFWTGITAMVGASVASTENMYGHEDNTMLNAGIGSKTGYNFEFKDGKLIIQPRIFISYSMVNTFDYKNSAGVKIKSDPLHTLQINPALRIIGNFEGWQPYASVGVVWNLLSETHATANGQKLPEMSTRPFIEYGIGLQRCWKENFSAYGQAMIHNGGRNGIALTGGFRWLIGKNKPETVQNKLKNKTVLKEL